MARPDDTELASVIHELAAPLAARHDVEVLEVRVKGQRGSRLVRLTADVADVDAEHDLDLETIAVLSRELGELLDAEDPIAGSYQLEVTSPGADRPLTRPRDFRRNVGRQVRVEREAGADGDASELTGALVDATDSDITLETDDDTHVVALATVVRGHVVLPW